MAIDVNALLAESKKQAAEAKKNAATAKAEAAKNKSLSAQANRINTEANSKFNYANNLEVSLRDLEGQIKSISRSISRGDKLSPIQEKELNRLVNQYNSVSGAYSKAIEEGNTILKDMPTGVTPKYPSSKKDGAAKDEAGIVGGDTGDANGVDVTSANDEINSLIKSAQQFIYDMKPEARKTLAASLIAAGIPTPEISTYSVNLVNSYKTFLNQAKSYNNTNKDIQGFVPVNFEGYLTYATGLQKEIKAAGGGDGDVYTPQANISAPSEADALINAQMKSSFGRDATSLELTTLRAALNKIEAANPVRRQGKRGGKYDYIGGVNPSEIIRQLIENPGIVNLDNIDKKSANAILKNVGKLNLATEYTKRKGDETQVDLDTLRATAQANGLPLSDAMVQKFAERLKAGEKVDVLKKDIRKIVGQTMPENIQALLDAGNDLEDVYLPYRSAMSTILEVPLDKINLNDPTLTGAITAQGNMPLYEFKNALRKDPRWQYTDNARETVSNGLTQVLKDFGFMG
jgi:TolA-binding protein